MRNKRDVHMTKETILANAKIILPDAVIPGSVVLRDGVISAGSRGVAADWGPFHSSRKRQDMQQWTRRQSYCSA